MARKLGKQALADLGREYKRINRLLLDELERQGIGVFEFDGVRISRETNAYKEFDVDVLEERIADDEVRERVIVRKVDGRALNSAHRKGEVSAEDIAAALIKTSTSAPYIKVTVA